VLKNIPAGPSRAVHSTLCAGRKRNGASDFDAGLGGSGPSGGNRPAEIELTYSTMQDINRARPSFGMLAVCIIQVESFRSRNGVLTRAAIEDIEA
jgi:hypothetical protein